MFSFLMQMVRTLFQVRAAARRSRPPIRWRGRSGVVAARHAAALPLLRGLLRGLGSR